MLPCPHGVVRVKFLAHQPRLPCDLIPVHIFEPALHARPMRTHAPHTAAAHAYIRGIGASHELEHAHRSTVPPSSTAAPRAQR